MLVKWWQIVGEFFERIHVFWRFKFHFRERRRNQLGIRLAHQHDCMAQIGNQLLKVNIQLKLKYNTNLVLIQILHPVQILVAKLGCLNYADTFAELHEQLLETTTALFGYRGCCGQLLNQRVIRAIRFKNLPSEHFLPFSCFRHFDSMTSSASLGFGPTASEHYLCPPCWPINRLRTSPNNEWGFCAVA